MKELNGSRVINECLCEEKFLERRSVVPVIYVRGSHFDVGFDTGRQFSSIIRNFVNDYGNLRRFEREFQTEKGRAAYDRTLANMQRRYPYYVKEIEGVAKGSGVPFYKLFLLHLDDIMDATAEMHGPRQDSGGCSDVGINRPGNSVLGHTEDAFTETLNHFYLVAAHIIPTPEDREAGAVEERYTSLCYAGQLPGYTMGFNEYGLIFTINTLAPKELIPGNTPRTFLARALLSARNMNDVDSILLDKGLGIANGFSMNSFWVDTAGGRHLRNIEIAPNHSSDRSLIHVKSFSEEPLYHCNRYMRLPVKEEIGPIIDSSVARLDLLTGRSPPSTRQNIAELLSITSGVNYTVFEKRTNAMVKTIAAGIFDMDELTWNVYLHEPTLSEPVAVLPLRFKQLPEPGAVAVNAGAT